MSTDNDTTNPLVLIPGGTTTVADSPSWLTTAAEHVLTRSSSCLALITPEGACALDIARRIADTAHTLTQGRPRRTAAALLIRKTSTCADALQAIRTIPGRIALVLEADDAYLQAESMTLPLWRAAVKEDLPLVITIRAREWEDLDRGQKDECVPAGTTTVHMAHTVCQKETRARLANEAKDLEAFHGVTIPSETIDAAADAVPHGCEHVQPLLGAHLLDLWSARATIQGCSRVESPTRSCGRTPCLRDLVAQLRRTIRGQDEAIQTVAEQVCLGRHGLRMRKDRVSSALLLTGTTGTGKTLMARTLAEHLGTDQLIRVDMAALSSDHLSATLLGAPPGYVGSQDKNGWLTTRIQETPRGILLFDEVEKASPAVWMPLLLELLGSGTLTDFSGRTVDCRGLDVILTANIGAEAMTRQPSGFGPPADPLLAARKSVRESMPPEIYNRLDAVVVMNTLDELRLAAILDDGLSQAIASSLQSGYRLRVTGAARHHLLKRAATWPDGARRLHREIETAVFKPLLTLEPGAYQLNVGEDAQLHMDPSAEAGPSGSAHRGVQAPAA